MSLKRARTRNLTNARHVEGLLPDLHPGTYENIEKASDTVIEEWLDVHVEFLVRLLTLTPRPTVKLSMGALDVCWPDIPRGMSAAFAQCC